MSNSVVLNIVLFIQNYFITINKAKFKDFGVVNILSFTDFGEVNILSFTDYSIDLIFPGKARLEIRAAK